MKKIFRNAIALLCVFGMLTSCATYSTLTSVETPENTVYGEDGESMQVVEDEKFLISAEGLSIEDSVGSVILSIGNKGPYDYRFHEDSIEFFGGNHEKNEWRNLGRWNAEAWSSYAYNRSSSDDGTPLFAFLLGMGVLGTVLDVYDSDAYSNWTDAFLTTCFLASFFDSVYDDDYYEVESMEDNLLHTKTVYSMEAYRGLVFFNADEYPDYMIRLHLDNGKPYYLVFQRSDREAYL